jgi:proteic killer suppression protein
MQVMEVKGLEGVGRALIGLIRLWKSVEKPEEPASKRADRASLGLFGARVWLVSLLTNVKRQATDVQEPEELRALPTWEAHTLTGDRKSTWSLSVTRNRRLTFRIDTAEREICDLNLEDYH